jgi:small subunit ribosomal protein S19e
MPTAFDVPPDKLIEKLARYLREQVPQVKPPEWASYVKTGSHKERRPANRDWWYVRCASILRKVYVHGPISVSRLQSMYGGRKKKGVQPAHHVDAGSSIIRRALHQLEEAGLVEKTPKGRVVTPDGRSLVDRISTEIFREMVKENPDLARIMGFGSKE